MIDAEDKENDSNSQQSCTRPPPLEKANFDVDLANFCQTRRSVLKEFDPLYPASPCTKVVNVENESGDQTKDKLETFPMVSITPNTELPISNQVEVQSGVDAAVHLTRLLVEDETSSEQSGTNLKPRSEPTAANNIVEYKKATVNAENESEDRPKDKLETSATLSITAHEELPESNQVEVQSGVDTVVNLTPILVEDETPLEPSGSDLKPIPEPAVANTIGERKTIVKDENESGNQPNETSAIVNITPNEKLPKSNQVEVKSGADTAVKLTPILAEDETSSGQYGSNLKPRSEPTATNTIGDYKKAIVNAENESEDRPKDKLETSAVVIITPNEELPKSTQGEVKSSADAAVNLTPILVEDETSFEPSGGAFKPIPEPAVANTIEEWKTIVKDESERGDRPKETYAIVGITPYEELPKSIQVEVKSGADTAPNLTRVLVEDEISSEPSGSDTLGECTIVEAENASGNRLKYKVETSAKVSMTLNEELPKSNQVEVQSGVDAAVHLTRILVEDGTSSEHSGPNLKPRSESTAANTIVEYKKATVNAENESEDRPKDKLEISATVSITPNEELSKTKQVEVKCGVDAAVNLIRILVEDKTYSQQPGCNLKPRPEPTAANTFGNVKKQSLTQRTKLILDEYEKRIAEQTKQLETLMSEKQATAKQFSNLELAFSDVFTRYEKLKVIIDKYKSNENILKLNLQSSEQALKLWEEKYQKLKKCSGDEVSRIALEKENITKEHEELHTSLRAMIKLLEIKCSSLETALMQKTRECRELEALCNDMSRKSK